MSSAVQIHRYLLYNLLNEDNKKQVLVILNTIDDKQTSLISEIAYNILRIPQSEHINKLVKRHKSLLTKLANNKVKSKSKVKLIRKHKKVILKLLFGIKKKLMQLLK